jgi:exodeoxyribonuclease-5
MRVELSVEQAAAIREIGRWYRSQSTPFITLGGYAGTGKTTLIGYLRQALGDLDESAKVGFCAYTGKAARVLASRLREAGAARRGDSVGTLHSLIYDAEDAGGGAVRWVRKDRLDRSLVIVDEASMVDETIWRDLLEFGIPVLAVGDHGQLPPVGSSFNLMAEPQVRLEKIWRQAALSPIIEVATLARQTCVIPVKEYGPGVRKLDRREAETGQLVEELLGGDMNSMMVLCGYNTTRVKLNQAMRSMRDHTSSGPESGDIVVCLRNNRTKHLYNGMLGTVIRVVPALDDINGWYEAQIELMGEDYEYDGYIWRDQFGASETTRDMPLAPDGGRGDLWDFGYALTVHKAQGSQAARVLLFEERFPRSSDEDWRRWLYTAVTRAETELTIIGY